MPVPSPRNKILPARGNFADLSANVASLLDGEICYAIDQDQYYQNEAGSLVSVGATKAQGILADTALQPLDNISELTNDAGYITSAAIPADVWTRSGTTLSPATAGDDVDIGSGNIALNADGSATFAGDVQSTSQNGSQIAGFRNQLINGNVVVRQRADTTANSFVADRWFTATAGCGTSNSGPDGLGLKRVITIPAAGGFIRQALELDNPNRQSQFYPGSTWTARVYATSAPQMRLAFRKTSDDATDQSEVLAFTAMAAGTTVDGFTEYTYTITMPDVTGDVETNQLKALVIWFQTSGAASLTGMTLEPGPVATPFEHRPIGTELALCQRYYFRSAGNVYGTAPDRSGVQTAFPMFFPTTMRANPTMSSIGTKAPAYSDISTTGSSLVINQTVDYFFSAVVVADAEL